MPKISIPIRCRILISLLQASYLIWSHYLIGLEKLPQNDPRHFEICPLDQKLWRYLFPCQLMCTVTYPLDWSWKTTPKCPLTLWNPSTGSEVTEISFSMSADVYSDLTIGLALKNYPKMSPHMLKLIHWIQSYNDISILSADLYSCTADLTSPLDWPEKTTPKWPFKCWNWSTGSKVIMIFPSCQLICTAVQLIWPHH